MSNFAAILVLVVCPADAAHCSSEPLRVVSYDSMRECLAERPKELSAANELGYNVLGECNPFQSILIANGTHINMVAGVNLNTGEVSSTQELAASYTGQLSKQ